MRNRIADFGLLTVEANHKTRGDEHASSINFMNAFDEIASRVLLLAHRHQSFWVWAFDANKQRKEICVSHHLQKFIIICDIDRCFSRKLERVVVLLLPLYQPWQELLQGFLVADQIVVDEIDVAAIAECEQPVEFGEYLRRSLSAG